MEKPTKKNQVREDTDPQIPILLDCVIRSISVRAAAAEILLPKSGSAADFTQRSPGCQSAQHKILAAAARTDSPLIHITITNSSYCRQSQRTHKIPDHSD